LLTNFSRRQDRGVRFAKGETRTLKTGAAATSEETISIRGLNRNGNHDLESESQRIGVSKKSLRNHGRSASA
jgi:hypothetical protein